jgi:hypothetical protein
VGTVAVATGADDDLLGFVALLRVDDPFQLVHALGRPRLAAAVAARRALLAKGQKNSNNKSKNYPNDAMPVGFQVS